MCASKLLYDKFMNKSKVVYLPNACDNHFYNGEPSPVIKESELDMGCIHP